MGNMIVSIFAEDLENYTSLRQLWAIVVFSNKCCVTAYISLPSHRDLSVNEISYIEPDSFASTAQLREM